jgi:L-glyceraldehyde 3-phosphate reductase
MGIERRTDDFGDCGRKLCQQLADNLKALDHLEFSADELKEIEQILPE